jgi:hypothetical protein
MDCVRYGLSEEKGGKLLREVYHKKWSKCWNKIETISEK